MAYDGVIDGSKVDQLCRRVTELRAINQPNLLEQSRIRDIMNGGPKAVRALLGPKANTSNAPYANLMLSAVDKLAQKLGRNPSIKKEPPATNDSEAAAKRVEKIARVVESYDDVCKMRMLLPQIGRWLPGYGYVAMVVRHGYSRQGDPMPNVELRDPFGTFPGEWGPGQQPRDVAFCRIIQAKTLADMYPQHREQILGRKTVNGGVLLDNSTAGFGDQASWANQSGGGLEVYEYYDKDGCWWVVPEKSLLLSYVPNLMRRPQFYLLKRFSFDRLVGQYDQILGLMAGIARMSLLLLIATEDSVMAETNVYGDTAQGDKYKFGRNQVNWMTTGTRVEKPNSQVPFQAFQFLNNFERQLRVGAAYPVTDDGNSPMSFVTGRGLDELSNSSDLLVREYFTVIQDGLMEIDSIRLEWDEEYYGDKTKHMAGTRAGTPFAETYTPKVHIKGDFMTRRVYGAMAGFDEPSKIGTGLQLLAAEIIDDDTMMENVDGLEDFSKIKERIRVKKAEKVVDDVLLNMAAQGDERALHAAIGMMPDSDHKRVLEDIFLNQPPPPEQQPAPTMPDFQAPDGMATAMSSMSTTGPGQSTSTFRSRSVRAA